MSFRRIEYFLSVAKHLNFTKAARECFVAQAAISQQIKQLEESLGIVLFERGKRGVALTPAGAFFAQQCRGILDQYNEAVKQARSISDGAKQELRLGICGMYSQQSFPACLRQYRKLYPDATITLRERGYKELLDDLARKEMDVIVIPDYGIKPTSDMEMLELGSQQARFMTGPQTPLAGRNHVTYEELVGQTIFCIEGNGENGEGQSLSDYFAQMGLRSNQIQWVKTMTEATILVQAGLGIAALPAGLEGSVARDVSVFSIEGDSFRIRTVALRRVAGGNDAAQNFFRVIRQELAKELS